MFKIHKEEIEINGKKIKKRQKNKYKKKEERNELKNKSDFERLFAQENLRSKSELKNMDRYFGSRQTQSASSKSLNCLLSG
jgi:hypothetical protein